MKHIIIKRAFEIGHLENFRFIIQNSEERNPNCNCGDSMTTLQIASQNSHLEICQEIFPYSNPRSSEYDDSSLDLATIKDCFDIFELIFRNIKIGGEKEIIPLFRNYSKNFEEKS